MIWEAPDWIGVRKSYHAALLNSGVLRMALREKPKKGMAREVPSNADGDSPTSIAIAIAVLDQVQTAAKLDGCLAGQFSGSGFEQITRSFEIRGFESNSKSERTAATYRCSDRGTTAEPAGFAGPWHG